MSSRVDDPVRAHLLITGRVQGVFYRAGATEEARRLGLTGWVRNVPDGSVEAVAEGSRAQVDALAEWCKRGPPSAVVADVALNLLPATGEYPDFSVKH